MYETDREKFVSVCSQTPEGVTPWEVGAVCLIDCRAEGHCDPHTVASYLDSMLGKEDTYSKVSSSMLGKEEVLLAFLSILLSDGPGKKETATDKGDPL